MKLDDYDAVAGLARGTWYLTKLVLRRFMLPHRRAASSTSRASSATPATRARSPYTMAKAGLDALTKSLAQELAGRDILVNSVAPGLHRHRDDGGAARRRSASRILARDPARTHGTARGGGRRRRLPRHRGRATSTAASSTSTGGCTVAEPLTARRGPGRAAAAGAVPLRRRDPRARRRAHRRARTRFRPDADFYRGHFPGNPITPGVLLVEAMAQAGVVALGIYLVARESERRGRRSACSPCSPTRPSSSRASCGPGDTVTISARKVFFRRMKLRAEVEMRLEDGTLVATATVAGMGIEAARRPRRGGRRDATTRRRDRDRRRRAERRSASPTSTPRCAPGRSGLRHVAEARRARLRLHGGRRAAGRRRDRRVLLRRGPAAGDELEPPLRRRSPRSTRGRTRASRGPTAPTTTSYWEAGAVLGTGIGGMDTIGEKVVPLTDAGKVRRLGSTVVEQVMAAASRRASRAARARQPGHDELERVQHRHRGDRRRRRTASGTASPSACCAAAARAPATTSGPASTRCACSRAASTTSRSRRRAR